jgi:hypothetical protein
MQIHEDDVKTTEAMASASDGFKFRGFKHFARLPFVIAKMASSLEASST